MVRTRRLAAAFVLLIVILAIVGCGKRVPSQTEVTAYTTKAASFESLADGVTDLKALQNLLVQVKQLVPPRPYFETSQALLIAFVQEKAKAMETPPAANSSPAVEFPDAESPNFDAELAAALRQSMDQFMASRQYDRYKTLFADQMTIDYAVWQADSGQ